MLKRMMDKGLLTKFGKSLFWVVPLDADAASYMPDWHLLAGPLSRESKYYIGYYSALQIHNLITQPSLKEQIVSDTHKAQTLVLKDVEFQFIKHNAKHFFGSKKMWIDSYSKVICSDLEKTLVDCLYMPNYAGGVVEVALYSRLHDTFPYLNIAIWDVGALMPLMHHIPNIRMTIVAVEKDGFLDVAETLGTLTDKLVFRTPTKDELVQLAFGRDFIVVRPLISQSPLQVIQGAQCPKLEKILVDILCDEEFHYLRGNETYYIYKSALADYSVNQKSLLRYAGRRGVADEVKQIIKTNEK